MKRRLHLIALGLRHNAQDIRNVIESSTGWTYGVFRHHDPDFRFVIRAGKGKRLVEFEAGLLGRGFFVGRFPC